METNGPKYELSSKRVAAILDALYRKTALRRPFVSIGARTFLPTQGGQQGWSLQKSQRDITEAVGITVKTLELVLRAMRRYATAEITMALLRVVIEEIGGLL